MTDLYLCHLPGQSELALLSYSGRGWNHKPNVRHISCFATAILDLHRTQDLPESF